MTRLPPAGSSGTWLGFDAVGGLWLLRWSVPGARNVWTAVGYDDRDFPAGRALAGEHAKLIVYVGDAAFDTARATLPDEVHPFE